MIPKIIHQIWIGDKPIPDKFKKYIQSWKEINPDYEYILWDNKKVTQLNSIIIKEILSNNELSNVSKSDFLRYFILKENGGLYVDTDFECYKSFDEFLNYSLIAGYEKEGLICNALIGSKKNNSFFDNLLIKAFYNYKQNTVSNCNKFPVKLFGPELLTKEFIHNENNKAFDEWYFYPKKYDSTEKNLKGNKPYACHHFQLICDDHWIKQYHND